MSFFSWQLDAMFTVITRFLRQGALWR